MFMNRSGLSRPLALNAVNLTFALQGPEIPFVPVSFYFPQFTHLLKLLCWSYKCSHWIQCEIICLFWISILSFSHQVHNVQGTFSFGQLLSKVPAFWHMKDKRMYFCILKDMNSYVINTSVMFMRCRNVVTSDVIIKTFTDRMKWFNCLWNKNRIKYESEFISIQGKK